jgi:hypothetical protein
MFSMAATGVANAACIPGPTIRPQCGKSAKVGLVIVIIIMVVVVLAAFEMGLLLQYQFPFRLQLLLVDFAAFESLDISGYRCAVRKHGELFLEHIDRGSVVAVQLI